MHLTRRAFLSSLIALPAAAAALVSAPAAPLEELRGPTLEWSTIDEAVGGFLMPPELEREMWGIVDWDRMRTLKSSAVRLDEHHR